MNNSEDKTYFIREFETTSAPIEIATCVATLPTTLEELQPDGQPYLMVVRKVVILRGLPVRLSLGLQSVWGVRARVALRLRPWVQQGVSLGFLVGGGSWVQVGGRVNCRETINF